MNKKIISKGAYLVDEQYRGKLTDKSTAIVMDNTISRKHNNKRKVAYFITENTELLAGQNTVAIFNIITKH
jgi:phosphoenolpyruvate carboxylase